MMLLDLPEPEHQHPVGELPHHQPIPARLGHVEAGCLDVHQLAAGRGQLTSEHIPQQLRNIALQMIRHLRLTRQPKRAVQEHIYAPALPVGEWWPPTRPGAPQLQRRRLAAAQHHRSVCKEPRGLLKILRGRHLEYPQ